MKAIVIREFGPPSVMKLEEVPTPEPAQGEVLIKVHAVSVNRTLDCVVRAGKYARRVTLPLTPASIRPGDRQAWAGRERPQGRRSCHGATARQSGQRRGFDPKFGMHTWGGYAEYVAARADRTALVPEGLDFATATVVSRHAPTAFTLLREHGQTKAGEWVLVMGAAGGLGSAGVQVAKYLGAKVIAAAGSDERVKIGLDLGADAGVNYRAQDLTKEVMRITEDPRRQHRVREHRRPRAVSEGVRHARAPGPAGHCGWTWRRRGAGRCQPAVPKPSAHHRRHRRDARGRDDKSEGRGRGQVQGADRPCHAALAGGGRARVGGEPHRHWQGHSGPDAIVRG